MPGDNRLVTENFLRLNFSPKSGVTPGTNDLISMDCDQIQARYNVTVSGITTTGLRCPSQNQIANITQGSISEATGITSSRAYHDCIWDGNGYVMTAGGIVCNTSPNATISNYSNLVDNSVACVGYTYRTGGIYWAGLTPNTTYYSRTYVTTSQGTFYSNEVVFTTLP